MRGEHDPIAGTIGTLTANEERELVTRMRPPHSPEVMAAARDRLSLAWVRLVEKCVGLYYRKHPRSQAEADDLVGVGILGMFRGMGTCDPSKGNRPSNYIIKSVYMAMHEYGMQSVSPLHIPRGTANSAIYEKSSLSDAGRLRAISAMRPPTNHDVHGAELVYLAVSPDTTDEEDDADEARHLVSIAMKGLDARQRRVITERYGLDGGGERFRKDILPGMGISRTTYDLAHKTAIKTMRDVLLRVAG